MGRYGSVLLVLGFISCINNALSDGKAAQPTIVGRRKAIKHKSIKAVKAPVPVKTEVIVPKPTVVLSPRCPDGYQFKGKDCVSKHEVPETYICPAGSEEYHGECHKKFHGKLVCHDGLKLDGVNCVGHETTPIVNQCPEGSIQHGAKCVVTLQHAPVCPPGTARVHDQCARFTPMVKECPVGYKQSGDLCSTQVYEDPDSVCPTGSIPDGHVCKVITSVEEVCPAGTVDMGDQCATYKGKMKECPKGYTKTGKECVRVERAPKVGLCANGGNPDEGCVVTIPVPPSPYCKVGKICSTGQCAKTKRLQPSYNCPAGYHLKHGTKCVKVTTYDCTATHQDIECVGAPQPSPAYTIAGSKGSHVGNTRHRILGVDAKGKHQNIHYSKVAAIPKCQKKAPVKPKTCEKTQSADAEAFCNEGVYKGTYCEVTEYFSPMYKCDAKSDHSGNCFVEERTPVLYTCPTGYTKSGEGCTKTMIEAPHYYCPPGSVEPNCAVYVDKVCPGGSCVSKIVESPKLICPEGYHMLQGAHNFASSKKAGYKHGHHSAPIQHDGPKCTKTMYTEKLSGCPRGTVEFEGLKCASFVDMVVQNSDKRVDIQRMCPVGYTEKGSKGECVKSIIFPAEVHCPHGSVQSGKSCLQSVPSVPSCPQGAIQKDGRCWATSLVTPIMVQNACGYDVGKSTCKSHYNKAVPMKSVKTQTAFKKGRNFGGYAHSQPVASSKGAPINTGGKGKY